MNLQKQTSTGAKSVTFLTTYTLKWIKLTNESSIPKFNKSFWQKSCKILHNWAISWTLYLTWRMKNRCFKLNSLQSTPSLWRLLTNSWILVTHRRHKSIWTTWLRIWRSCRLQIRTRKFKKSKRHKKLKSSMTAWETPLCQRYLSLRNFLSRKSLRTKTVRWVSAPTTKKTFWICRTNINRREQLFSVKLKTKLKTWAFRQTLIYQSDCFKRWSLETCLGSRPSQSMILSLIKRLSFNTLNRSSVKLTCRDQCLTCKLTVSRS